MTAPGCSQLWLVEAIRDGRVVGDERASFERHRSSCVVCTAAAQAAQAEREQLAELPTGLPDTFSLRRQRRALLQAFDASLVRAPIGRASHRGRLIACSAAFAITVGLGVWLFWRTPGTASWVQVVAGSGAKWSEQKTSDVDRITLRRGRFQLSIRRPSPTNRVQIALPDGEIEDLGTVLEVWTDGVRTQRVAVTSGAVVLRLHDAPDLRLRAGQVWDRATLPETTPEASAQLERPSFPAGDHAAPHVPIALPRRVASPLRAASSPTGAHAPDNAGVEDAAYLRLLADFQAGRQDDARTAAREYLAAFPHGFRRLEVARMAAELGALR